MFISTRQASKTFFHQIAPSQTLKVQLNPKITDNFFIEKMEIPSQQQEVRINSWKKLQDQLFAWF